MLQVACTDSQTHMQEGRGATNKQPNHPITQYNVLLVLELTEQRSHVYESVRACLYYIELLYLDVLLRSFALALRQRCGCFFLPVAPSLLQISVVQVVRQWRCSSNRIMHDRSVSYTAMRCSSSSRHDGSRFNPTAIRWLSISCFSGACSASTRAFRCCCNLSLFANQSTNPTQSNSIQLNPTQSNPIVAYVSRVLMVDASTPLTLLRSLMMALMICICSCISLFNSSASRRSCPSTHCRSEDRIQQHQ
jgi:hypothetical protein